MKCIALSTVTAVILTYFIVTTTTAAMAANGNNPKAPAASSLIAARPHFPILSNAEVALREKLFLKDLQNKAVIKVMAGDGACFFHSICDQLYQDEGEGHAALRAAACDWI